MVIGDLIDMIKSIFSKKVKKETVEKKTLLYPKLPATYVVDHTAPGNSLINTDTDTAIIFENGCDGETKVVHLKAVANTKVSISKNDSEHPYIFSLGDTDATLCIVATFVDEQVIINLIVEQTIEL